MTTDLRRIQNIEIDMLKEFHKVCMDNNLTYYVLGGTLLGAVRHGGFIPWDDDIDIGMPRKDYEVFLNSASSELPTNLKLYSNPLNLNISQIVDVRTKIKLGTQITGVFIDVFPLDGYPKGKIEARLHSFKILFYRMLCKLSVIDKLDNHDRGILENSIVKITRLTKFNKLLNEESLVKKLHRIIQRYDFSSSEKVGNVLGRYREKEIVDKSFFGEPKLVKFEDIQVMAPERIEDYLENIYGDFMQLPPKEQQLAHDITIIKLSE